MKTTAFMRPCFTGARFNAHGIPLELLGELAVFEEMIVEVAKWIFLREHPSRKRSPRGFLDGADIKLIAVEEGSAIPVLSLVQTGATLFPSDDEIYFEKARDSIISAIHAAAHDSSVTQFLPEKALGYFDRIGRGLRDGEAIEFTLPNGRDTARLTKETRRNLLLASANVRELTEGVVMRGCISAVDQGDMIFEIQLLDGRRLRAPLGSQHLDTVLEAFAGYKTGTRIMLKGIGRFSRYEKLLGIDSVEHVSLLDPLDLSVRLEELAELKDGWLDGKGLAPSRAGLQWLSQICVSSFPDDLPFPYAYPTPEGGIQLEWGLGDTEASLEIELASHAAHWHALHLKSGAETFRSLNLDETMDWRWILDQIRQLG